MNEIENFSEILNNLMRLSFKAMGFSSPNPPVACVITDLNGKILVEAHTQRAGENHAEREAYRIFKEKYSNFSEVNHIVFVTLEPCTHFGRTPPCIDLILEHKPKCVYYGLADPNPLVRKRDGFAECKKIGIEVIQSLEIEKIGRVFLSGFLSRIEKERPQAFIKSALSREGYFSNQEKSRISLSNPFSNQVTQMLRAKLDAIIVGPMTVYRDLPQLNFRGLDGSKILEKSESLNNSFTELLFQHSFDKEMIEYHNNHLNFYQPYRIFILSMNHIPEERFFSNQMILNKHRKTSLFILLDFNFSKPDHAGIYEKLLDLSFQEPVIIDKDIELEERLIEISQKLSLNTILVEGGNLLYKLFSKDLSKDDFIFLIHTTQSIPKGIRPEINYQSKKKIYEKKIDTDTWEVYGD